VQQRKRRLLRWRHGGDPRFKGPLPPQGNQRTEHAGQTGPGCAVLLRDLALRGRSWPSEISAALTPTKDRPPIWPGFSVPVWKIFCGRTIRIGLRQEKLKPFILRQLFTRLLAHIFHRGRVRGRRLRSFGTKSKIGGAITRLARLPLIDCRAKTCQEAGQNPYPHDRGRKRRIVIVRH
jgi:hypothetical protein